MPSSNPWLRPCRKGRQNSVERDTETDLSGLLKLHLYLSSLVHESVDLVAHNIAIQNCQHYPGMTQTAWKSEIHTTSVSFIHGELVMQFMFVMLVKQHGNHLGISCDC